MTGRARLPLRWRRRERPQPLRRRLVALVLGFMALGLLTAHVGTDWALKAFLVNRVDRQLDLAGRVSDRYIVELGPGLPVFGAGTQSQAWEFLYSAGLQLSFLQTRDTSNHIVQTLGQPDGGPVLPAVLPLGSQGADRPAYFDAPAHRGGGEYRVRTARFPNGVGTYAIAMPLTDVNDTMRRLIIIEATLSAVFLAFLGALGVRAVRRALRPLRAIEREAGEVGAGDLSRRVAMADDRTEVGRLGLALNGMLDQLEGAFAERQASEERLRRFVADASHELRTPLASIRGYAELFRRGAAERPEDLAKAMSRIESEAARMGVLVDELLLLARLDSGRPLARQPVDVAALVVEAVEDSRVVDPERPWLVEVPGGDGGRGCVVCGDGDRLRQVVGNLLANVRAHTPPETAGTVRVSPDPDAGAVVVEVHDDGPGMTEDAVRRAFDRFYRSDFSRRRDPGGRVGSGLGLAIAEAVVRAHGGVIGLESAPGAGTTVRLVLPLADPDAASVDGTSVDGPSAAGRST